MTGRLFEAQPSAGCWPPPSGCCVWHSRHRHVALADTYREAVQTSNIVSDRVLAGSALAIAERVVVAEDGSLQVDIPYVALEMLTSAAQDRVFYRVDGPPGDFITGYQALPVLKETPGRRRRFADDSFRNEPIRVATLAAPPRQASAPSPSP
jgi:two-component system sensor histidine kinase TctE